MTGDSRRRRKRIGAFTFGGSTGTGHRLHGNEDRGKAMCAMRTVVAVGTVVRIHALDCGHREGGGRLKRDAVEKRRC